MPEQDCHRELEVFAAISTGAWPDACDQSLREHVTGCASCADLTAVAAAIHADRDEALQHAAIPSSGVVWWRMQQRSRRDATRAARRTVLAAQAAVFAAVLGIALAISAPAWWDKLPHVSEVTPLLGMAVAQWALPLMLALVIWLTLAPVAIWLAVTEE